MSGVGDGRRYWRRKPHIIDGLALGADRAGLSNLGEGMGEGLLCLEYGAEWLVGGVLPIPQPCPKCRAGTYSSLAALRLHVQRMHIELSSRQRSQVYDEARIACRLAVRRARGE